MELPEIEANLTNPDFQYRLKAIRGLKDQPAAVAVPLLLQRVPDPEFLVRSFVAMGLGKQQTAESFAALLELMRFDNTPSVRAEAANSLSLFGLVSASHLVQTAVQDDHWLVRRSILAALTDLECTDELLEVCLHLLNADEDETVQAAAIDALASLANSSQQDDALKAILGQAQADSASLRTHAASALKQFEQPTATAALIQLRQDPDHRVAGAALENLLP
jgi:HEAT repeat protein